MERKHDRMRRIGPLLLVAGLGVWLLTLPVRTPRIEGAGAETGWFGMAIAHAETADSSSAPPRPVPDDPTRPHP